MCKCFIVFISRVDMFVHQTWKESRLKLPNDIFEEGDDYVTLPPEFFENLWQPELQIQNSKIAGIHSIKVYIVLTNFYSM